MELQGYAKYRREVYGTLVVAGFGLALLGFAISGWTDELGSAFSGFMGFVFLCAAGVGAPENPPPESAREDFPMILLPRWMHTSGVALLVLIEIYLLVIATPASIFFGIVLLYYLFRKRVHAAWRKSK